MANGKTKTEHTTMGTIGRIVTFVSVEASAEAREEEKRRKDERICYDSVDWKLFIRVRDISLSYHLIFFHLASISPSLSPAFPFVPFICGQRKKNS